jgi:hypothetical protein
MLKPNCGHQSGAFVGDLWVCAHCFEMLPERPKKYQGGIDQRAPQQIVWEAPIAMDKKGTTLAQFLKWMIDTIRRRTLWTVSRHDALKMSLEALKDQGERFGSPHAGWTKSDANGLLAEAVFCYWEDFGGRN